MISGCPLCYMLFLAINVVRSSRMLAAVLGKLNLYDAIEIAKFIMDMVNFTEQGLVTADYNCDGKVNLYDVIAVAIIIMK